MSCDSGVAGPEMANLCRRPEGTAALSIALDRDGYTLSYIGERYSLDPRMEGDGTDFDITWEVADPSVVSIDESGTLQARAPGSSMVRVEASACYQTASAEALVRVEQIPETVAFTAEELTLDVGEYRAPEVVVLDAGGHPIASPAMSWETSDPAVASVDESGTIAAMSSGTADVLVGAGEYEAQTDGNCRRRRCAWIRVSVGKLRVSSLALTPPSLDLAVGASATLEAEARDKDGNVVDTSVEWSSSDASIVTVSSEGRVTALGVGTATVEAKAGGVTTTAEVKVAAVPVASVSLDPSDLNLTVGQSSTVRATLQDANGNTLDRPVTWSSANSDVASVRSNGQVTARSTGETTITATAEGKSASLRVSVSSVPVASVSVEPGSMELHVGARGQLRATARDASGNALDRTVQWSSSNSGVATVAADGTVTARSAGSATVTASSGSVSGNASITVAVAPVASVSLDPSDLSLTVGQSSTVRATLEDANGNTLDRPVSWSSANSAVASVSSNGQVTARSTGSTTITATAEGKSASVSVTVSAVPVASVAVQPNSLDLTVGDGAQLQATLEDANGNTLDRPVSWSSANSAVASVSSSGQVTARAAGTTRITASSEGKTGTAQVTVSVEPVSRVDVSPSNVSMNVGETSQLAATPRDASGNPLNRSVSWTSSNTSVVTVDQSGRITARAGGSATIRATSESVSGSARIDVTQPTQSGDLSWRPPSGWSSYTKRTLPASGGVVTLDDNTDYLLQNPTTNGGVINGTLTIKGGRNVVWIGGEIRIDTYKQDSESVQSGVRVWRSDRTRVQGRIVHLEGLLIHGQHLADGIVINAPEAIVQAQNIHARPNRPFSSGIHADVIQSWGGVGELRVDHLTGYTSYQGFMLKADFNGPAGPMDFRNVNLSDNGTNSSRYLVWWTPDKNSTIQLQDVWVRLASSKSLGKAVWPDRDASDSSLRPTVTTDATSPYAEWRGTSQVSGRVREGTPPGGDFVSRTEVGLGYTSPGYR